MMASKKSQLNSDSDSANKLLISKEDNEDCSSSKCTATCSELPDDSQFFDDGTVTFFWRAHTVSVLIAFIGMLIYLAIFEPVSDDTYVNSKRGILACVGVFIIVGVTVTPDGVFKRPHPVVWRFTFCCSIVYELGLIFILFQNKKDAIRLLHHIDPTLEEQLVEKNYGGNCKIYDYNNFADPFHNVKEKLDIFVPTHFFGWWAKTLVLRDWWLCTVLSVMFELLEYTLEHQLPNFSECWWDHWILDALVCNGLGIYLGMKTLQYFSMKTYHWRGLWSISSYRGKIRRIMGQFGPYMWLNYDWRAASSLGRWIAVLGIIFVFLVAELNTFYLKFVMRIAPEHYFNLVRLIFILLWGAVSMREVFQYLDDPDCTTIGRQSWMTLAVISSELLIVVKFDWDTITIPIPSHIAMLWLVGLTILVLWTSWKFLLSPAKLKWRSKSDEEQRRLRWKTVRSVEFKHFSPS